MSGSAKPTRAPRLAVREAHASDCIVCALCGLPCLGPTVEVNALGREPEQVCGACAIRMLAPHGVQR